jgi:putative membrane protein
MAGIAPRRSRTAPSIGDYYLASPVRSALTAVSPPPLTRIIAARARACEAAALAIGIASMDLAQVLPHINASLNAVASVLLLAARWQIARRNIEAHRRLMLSALAVSALFLVGYIIYHQIAPIFVFRGQGWIRPVYYALLISHVLLAALAIPLIAATAWFGLRRVDRRHRPLARWTWPLWMYVSASGVLVYLLLYQLY